jgi:hypothetical protein
MRETTLLDMEGQALIAWIATAGVGLSLLGIWFERGGLRFRGARRITPKLLLTHITPAVTGLLLWIVFLITDTTAIAWLAFAVILGVGVVGSIQFFIWQRRRHGILRATPHHWDLQTVTDRTEQVPAEQHFPVGAVVLHGALAITTVVFVFITALQSTTEKERPATGAAAAVTATTATLHGTPGDYEGRPRFQIGQSRRYGRTIAARAVKGDGIVAAVGGLVPATQYHYRLLVGDETGPDRTLVTRPPRRVELSDVSVTPRTFDAGGNATVRYTLNAPATLRVGVYRALPRHRYRRTATLVLDGRPGPNAQPIGALPQISVLPPGGYRLVTVAAVAGGRPSAPESLRVRIVKG